MPGSNRTDGPKGTPMGKGSALKPIDIDNPVPEGSVNMMGEMLQNEQPTIDQTREIIRKSRK